MLQHLLTQKEGDTLGSDHGIGEGQRVIFDVRTADVAEPRHLVHTGDDIGKRHSHFQFLHQTTVLGLHALTADAVGDEAHRVELQGRTVLPDPVEGILDKSNVKRSKSIQHVLVLRIGKQVLIHSHDILVGQMLLDPLRYSRLALHAKFPHLYT